MRSSPCTSHRGTPRTLTTKAREAHMTRSTFAARFKQTVGQAPADYVTEWRLMVAQDRLRAGTSLTATATATELGYASPSALSRVFSQRRAQSPRSWLASAQIN